MQGMVFGTRVLKYWVLGPSGSEKTSRVIPGSHRYCGLCMWEHTGATDCKETGTAGPDSPNGCKTLLGSCNQSRFISSKTYRHDSPMAAFQDKTQDCMHHQNGSVSGQLACIFTCAPQCETPQRLVPAPRT